MKKFNFYKDQIKRITNSEFNKTVQFRDGVGYKTHNIDLNVESIPILIKFLEKELKYLKQKTE